MKIIPLFGFWHPFKFICEKLYEFGFQQLFNVIEEVIFSYVPKKVELLHLYYLYTYITLAKEDKYIKENINDLKSKRNLHTEWISWLQSLDCIIYEVIPTIREYVYETKLQNFDYYFQLLKRIFLILLKIHLKESKYCPTLLIWILMFVFFDEIGEVYFSLFARITTNMTSKQLKWMPIYYRYV